MDVQIEFDSSFPLLTISLDRGESVTAEPGAMVAQQGVKFRSGMGGQGQGFFRGLARGIKRMVSGESFFLNTFTGTAKGDWVSLAPPTPGGIHEMELDPGDSIILQNGAFLACTGGVVTELKFEGLRGVIGGTSMFFIRATADREPGFVFYHSYGAIKPVPVMPDRDLILDTGHLVGFTEHLDYRVDQVGGLRSLVVGGEGLVLRFRGSGTVWVQSLNMKTMAERLVPFLPTPRREDS